MCGHDDQYEEGYGSEYGEGLDMAASVDDGSLLSPKNSVQLYLKIYEFELGRMVSINGSMSPIIALLAVVAAGHLFALGAIADGAVCWMVYVPIILGGIATTASMTSVCLALRNGDYYRIADVQDIEDRRLAAAQSPGTPLRVGSIGGLDQHTYEVVGLLDTCDKKNNENNERKARWRRWALALALAAIIGMVLSILAVHVLA
jgi:hypothetical protein